MSDGTQTTLRDMLSSSMDAADEGNLTPAQDAPVINEDVATDAIQESAESRSRDDKGRFAAQQKEDAAKAEAAPEVKQEPSAEAAPIATNENAIVAQPSSQRPTTWKKEYLPIWDKIESGQPLTPDESKKLAAYSVQREREYATGVSTYRQEAQNAKHLQEALTPFIPTMQKRGLNAVDFIKNLGTTYAFLADGSPQQKLQAFARLAQDVGIPLEAITQSQGNTLDPIVPQLMQHIQALESKVNGVYGWREQQEQNEVNNIISKFENNPQDYPHFATVRGTMGRLLETGLATDLETAYATAIRMNPEAWQAENERQVQPSVPVVTTQNKAAAAAAAKAKAVSVRSVTPTGTAKPVDAKDLRSALTSGFDSMLSNRV